MFCLVHSRHSLNVSIQTAILEKRRVKLTYLDGDLLFQDWFHKINIRFIHFSFSHHPSLYPSIRSSACPTFLWPLPYRYMVLDSVLRLERWLRHSPALASLPAWWVGWVWKRCAECGVRGRQGSASAASGHCAGLLPLPFHSTPLRCVMAGCGVEWDGFLEEVTAELRLIRWVGIGERKKAEEGEAFQGISWRKNKPRGSAWPLRSAVLPDIVSKKGNQPHCLHKRLNDNIRFIYQY